MADSYDTPLTPDQQKAYEAWGKAQQATTGRNPTADTEDYDMQGWFRQNGPVDLTAGAHFPDTYKKPNHPTFSTHSKYSGEGENAGGVWEQASDGSWSFTPGPTNLKHFTPAAMQDYFTQREPTSRLNLTQAQRLFRDHKP